MQPVRNLLPWLFRGIYSGDDLESHLTAIRLLESRRSEAYEHGYMYECLGILDSKAQALLAYDAILLTGASIILSVVPSGNVPATVLVVIALVAISVSSVLCLTVVQVHWTDTDDFSHANERFTSLLMIRNRRTLNYRLAWVIAQFSTVDLVLGLSLQSAVA